MTQQELFSVEDLDRELADARRHLAHLLECVQHFTLVTQEQPWWHLEDMLRDLRAAATTVAVLERTRDRIVR